MKAIACFVIALAFIFKIVQAKQNIPSALAGVFAGSGSTDDQSDPDKFADLVTYPLNYLGSGGVVEITFGIHPDSPNADAMITPTKNALRTWNLLKPTHGNFIGGGISMSEHDFETVLLHEIGHVLGLDHPNLSQKFPTGTPPERRSTNTVGGVNEGDPIDIGAGADGSFGSHDDVRDDDINLFYFRKGINNPFTIDSVFDSTTYSRDVADLPSTTPANAFFGNTIGSDIGAQTDSTRAIELGDIDGDGDLDVVVGNDQVPNRLYLNNGTSNPFSGVSPIDIDTSFAGIGDVTCIALGDLNNDGHLDLVVGREANDENIFYINNGTSNPFSGVSLSQVSSEELETQAIDLGDIDGDGLLDLVVGNLFELNKFYINNGNGFDAGVTISNENLVRAIALADLDADNDLDVILARSGQNYFHLNISGTYGPAVILGVEEENALSLAVRDVNKDGRPDVFVGNSFVHTNRLYINDPSVSPPFNGVVAQNISSDLVNTTGIAVAEINVDGELDVVTGQNGGDEAKFYANDGTTSPFSSATAVDISTDRRNTHSVDLGDVDNDGDLDLVTGNGGETNRLYLNSGPVYDFPVNANRDVAQAYGFPSTEAVMTGDGNKGEVHRELGHDDVATLRYAMSGHDEIQGNADDFTLNLVFLGKTDQADVVLDFDSTQITLPSAIADTDAVITFVPSGPHLRINSADIFFREEESWFFNTTLNSASIFADFLHAGIEDGTQQFPFNTIQEAVDDVAIGGTINILPGDSSETLTIDKEMTMVATAASARIGVLTARMAGAQSQNRSSSSSDKKESGTGFVSRQRR